MTTATSIDSDTQFKAISGQIGIDKAQGIVEAFVSAIGNKDSVGDIVIPGAFNDSLKRRKPRVVWGHDWNQPIGKVLEIYEVAPNDPRLPAKMKNAGVGGLFAKVQFNLNTERGREAFANVAFYGNEQEWSIGYKTINADFDAIKQANILKEVELYEISPVLHGANQLTATISVKDDSSGAASKSSSEDLKGAGVYMKPTGMVPSASWDDDDDDDDDMSERLGMMLSQVLRKPVKIIEMGRDTIIFQTAPDMMWRASVTMGSGQMMIGRPTRVKPMVTYTPVGDSAPASMMIKYTDEKDAEEPEGIRDSSDDQGSWDTPEAALAWAKTLGCQGFHTLGNGYLPCDSHADYLDAIRMFDDNANINSRNNYLAGVDVSEAKGAAGTCGCGSEVKGHMYVQDKKPDYLQDPMALMLMAYNEMLKLRGATEVREATLSVISALEEFLTEAPMSIGMEQGEKIASGVIVHVKCSEIEALSVSKAVADLPVFTFKSDSGVDVHFTTLAEEDEIFEKVAFALAKLDFDPGLKFTRPTEI